MNSFIIFMGSFFALLASVVIAHVSMVAAMGPWIAPIIVIISGVFARLRFAGYNKEQMHQELALIQTIGSVGGIVAMGIGFTLPMLYFLQPEAFNQWMANPGYFSTLIAAVCLSAGGLGIWFAKTFAGTLIIKERLKFPVSSLIYKTITAQSQTDQARQLFTGFSISAVMTFVRDGFAGISGFIPRVSYVLPNLFGRDLAFGFAPMLWAMGFIVGMGIVFPLLIGMVSRYVVLAPLNNHSLYLPFTFFEPMRASTFAQAFCSGLVLVSLSFTIARLPKALYNGVKGLTLDDLKNKITSWLSTFSSERKAQTSLASYITYIEPIGVFLTSYLFLRSFNFSLLSQIFMILLTAIFAYQISYFSGKVGLVPFGRFTTFVMVPTMLLFRLDYLQITILCVFCNLVYALATDLLFDYKIGEMCGLDFKTIHRYQWLGLIVTSLGMGFMLWILFTNFQLGSEQLFALRAKNRALLIQSIGFDWQPLILGYIYGLFLHYFKINSMMVFGGILMPGELTIGLMVGAMLSWFDSKAKDHLPFWSGFFVGESMLILLSLIVRIV